MHRRRTNGRQIHPVEYSTQLRSAQHPPWRGCLRIPRMRQPSDIRTYDSKTSAWRRRIKIPIPAMRQPRYIGAINTTRTPRPSGRSLWPMRHISRSRDITFGCTGGHNPCSMTQCLRRTPRKTVHERLHVCNTHVGLIQTIVDRLPPDRPSMSATRVQITTPPRLRLRAHSLLLCLRLLSSALSSTLYRWRFLVLTKQLRHHQPF